MQLLRNATSSGEERAEDATSAQVEECAWTLLADDAPLAEHANAAVAVSYSRYLAEPALLNQRSVAWTVVIAPDDELLEVVPELLSRPEILVAFPAYTDGRGYSHAATLRLHHGFTGDLVAIGDVRRDQLDFMRHSGFTAFEITGNDSVDDMRASLGELVMPAAHRLYSGAAL